jgi:hypothetical protein
MFPPTIISTVLALAPPTDLARPDFGSQLDSVEFIDGGEDVQLVAYDAGGEVIGSIAFWRDRGGGLHVLSDYGDGYAEVVFVDGEATITATLAPAVVGDRAALIGDRLYHEGHGPKGKPWASCAFSVLGTAASCAAATPICPLTAIPLACNCLPLIVKEWEGKKCPGFG